MKKFTAVPSDECLALLGSVPLGRICFADGDGVAVRPVTFVVAAGEIFFRTAAGSKLLSAAQHSRADFEVDAYELQSGTGWSVIATGSLRLVGDAAAAESIDAQLRPWMPGELLHLVGLKIESLSGRRIRAD